MKFLFLVGLISFLLIPNISKASAAGDSQEDSTLVRIENKTISINEFQLRSELAVRPAPFKEKNITLNNLITEKILSLEAEKKYKELLDNPLLNGKIKGIKEQEMRDRLYEKEASAKVVIDSAEVLKKYKASIREYDVEYYVLQNDSIIKYVNEKQKSANGGSTEIFNEFSGTLGKKPIQQVRYLDPGDERVTAALFETLLDTGAVIGPLKLASGEQIILKVVDWRDYPLLSPEDQQLRWKRVEEKICTIEADRIFLSYSNNVLGNKKLVFHEKNINTLADYAFKYYLKNKGSDSLNIEVREVHSPKPEINGNEELFKFDNEVWTVEKFTQELVSHPLVYRTKNLNETNFPVQFQLAILDMIRDYLLTKEAYKQGIDKAPEVVYETAMWQDYYLAAGYQRNFINAAIDRGDVSDTNQEKLHFWESHIKNLQKEYSKSIKINFSALNKVKLSGIDFIAIRPGVPFPLAVPKFPIFIGSGNLDYANAN